MNRNGLAMSNEIAETFIKLCVRQALNKHGNARQVVSMIASGSKPEHIVREARQLVSDLRGLKHGRGVICELFAFGSRMHALRPRLPPGDALVWFVVVEINKSGIAGHRVH